MYSDFVFLDRFLFELSCKNTHTHGHTHTHRDSNEYPIVAFSKNATIIIKAGLHPLFVDKKDDKREKRAVISFLSYHISTARYLCFETLKVKYYLTAKIKRLMDGISS